MMSPARAGVTRTGATSSNASEAATTKRSPRPRRGARPPKIYYGTQTGTRPPTFSLFVNQPEHFAPDYARYLEARLREELGFPEVPVKIVLRPRREEREDAH